MPSSHATTSTLTPPPGEERTQHHALNAPTATLNSAANRRAKSDGVPGGGDMGFGTPPPGAPRSLSPADAFADRSALAGLSDGAPPSPLQGEAPPPGAERLQ